MELLQYLHDFSATHWEVILSYLGAGGTISVLLQFVKKLRRWDSGAWIQFVLVTMTSVAATANYVINNYITSPLPTIFGNFAPKILLAALIVHRLAVSPLSKLIEQKFIPFLITLKQAVNQLEAEKNPAAQPKAVPLPTETFES